MEFDEAIFLAKLGELTLKGGNIRFFEKKLVENLRAMLGEIDAKVYLRAGRMFVSACEKDAARVESALSHLFGIAGWARTAVCEKKIEEICAAVEKKAREAASGGAKTFKIEVRRSDKSFPLNSYETAVAAASPVDESRILKVDVHNPDAKICVEIREKAFVYCNSNRASRGLPVGTGGKALLLLSGGFDSPVAGWRILRRGMSVDCVYFHAHPYTSAEAQKKVEDLAALLAQFGISLHLNIVPFAQAQMKIKENSCEKFATLLLRMAMIEEANKIAAHIGAKCLVTGESLGQVASQTIENLAVTENMAKFPVLRPLIGLDKEEIIETSKKIGAYDISARPYEDCCTLFSPKHPVLRSTIEESREIYEKIGLSQALEEAFLAREVKKFSAQF